MRSIVHILSDERERLNRPIRLAVNFRSHSGILVCAGSPGSVLDLMFELFSGSAKVLHLDFGPLQRA